MIATSVVPSHVSIFTEINHINSTFNFEKSQNFLLSNVSKYQRKKGSLVKLNVTFLL